MLTDYEIHYSFNDNRKLKVIRPADQDYINKEWLPEMLKTAAIRKSATIESEDTFGKMSSDQILWAADEYLTFDIAFFDNLAAALKWLGVEVNLVSNLRHETPGDRIQ